MITTEDPDITFSGGHFYKRGDGEAINVTHAGAHANGRTALGNMPTTVNLGFEFNYFKEGELQGSAVAVGGIFNVNIPEVPGLSLETAVHYAPGVLAFDDADGFANYRLQGNYRLIQSADVTAGYNIIQVEQKEGDSRTFESKLFVGLRINF